MEMLCGLIIFLKYFLITYKLSFIILHKLLLQ